MISYDKKLHIYTSTLIPYSGFGTKFNGDGRVHENRRKLIDSLEIPYTTIVSPHQCHSNDVRSVLQTDVEGIVTLSEDRCDGVVTKENGVALTIITADCVPIIFSDPVARVIGISHQGWKGTLGMLPKITCNQMVTYGAKIENICCVIGPAINDCCYEIYGERKEMFEKSFSSDVFRTQNGKTYLNLMKANYLTLIAAGIKKEHIDFFPFCTSCNEKQFYSNFRDKGIKGEIISYIVQ